MLRSSPKSCVKRKGCLRRIFEADEVVIVIFASHSLTYVAQGVQIIAADPDIEAGRELGPALTDDDGTGRNSLATIGLNTTILRIAVAAVSGTAAAFFMSHVAPDSLFPLKLAGRHFK